MSRKLALIIGNSEYEDTNLAQLVTPGADANTLAEILRDPEIGGFDEVSALVNHPAASIRRAVAGFFVGRGRDDLLLLYFSGHGIRDDRGQLFLAVKDTEHNLLRGTAIPAAFITDEMDNSRSRRQVLILDCCHSGAFARGMKGTPGASVGTATAFEGTGSGRVVLTATDSTQYAWEGDRVIGQADNSVFTHYLIQGLRTGEADNDADGHTTLDELYDYVYEQVVNETPRQTPSKWSYGQQGELVIARNPRPVLKPAELPPDLQQTINDPRPWVREGAVRELDRLIRGSYPGLALAAKEALKRMADDDSRRVANMAAESLAAYAEAQGVREKAEAGREEQERRAHQRAEAERGAREKEAQEQLARDRAARERPAQEKAEAGGKAAEKTGAKAGQPEATITRAVADELMRWPPVLLTTIGWAICWAFAWVVSEAYGWAGTEYGIAWTILGAIGGLITGLVLQRTEQSIQWKQILLITLGWAIGMTISGSFYDAVGEAIGGSIRGAIGGLITALVLQRTERSIQWMHILLITLGWAIGMAIGDVVGDISYEALAGAIGGSIGWWTIPGALVGAISGAIGSGIMFWQLGQARRHAANA